MIVEYSTIITFSIAEMVISLIAKSGQDSNVDVVLNEKES